MQSLFAAVDTSIWGISRQLSDLKNRPDPPSERLVLRLANSVHQLDQAVAVYAEASNLQVAEVWKQIGTPGGLRSEFAPPQEDDLVRLPFPSSEGSTETEPSEE